MAPERRTVDVWADWRGLPKAARIGVLRARQASRGNEVFSFEYDREWLDAGQVQSLDPSLQLVRGPQYAATGRENFGVFLDSSPDRWGRVLMQRREAQLARETKRSQRTLYELDYLLGVFDGHRMGALRYRMGDGPFLDDNISMTQAFLELYRSTGNREWLKVAMATLDFIDAKLRDPRAGYMPSLPISKTGVVLREPVRDAGQNAAVVRAASMLHHYTAAERHLRIARHAMKYLSGFAATTTATDQFRPDILLADHELSAAPIHITVVGGKDDPAAQSLHAAALQYPTDFLQVDWWDRREGKLPDPTITYPDLRRPAAFACTANACSTPVYVASEIQDRVRSVLN